MTPAESRLREAVEHGYPHHTLTIADAQELLAEIDRLHVYRDAVYARGEQATEWEVEIDRLRAEKEALREALRALIRGYVNTLENGRDRIVMLGGQCDAVPQMEASDPYLIAARAALAAKE